jgi:hypothetical protein
MMVEEKEEKKVADGARRGKEGREGGRERREGGSQELLLRLWRGGSAVALRR